jgi:2-hydroxy-6-oxonona-2,4-dienedioate hydrolase
MRMLKRIGWGLLAVLALAAITPYLIPLPERTELPDTSPYANGDFVQACGLRWHLQRWSPPAPAAMRVVLLHGFAGSTFSWRLTGPALAAAGFEVLAIDQPNYGFSERADPNQPLPQCLAQLVDEETPALPVVLIGHSMGASVAARVAQAMHPRATGLVLVDGPPGGRGRPPSALATVLQWPPLSRWAEVVAHLRMLQPERFAQTLASAYGRVPSAEEVDAYRRPLLVAGTAAGVLSPSAPLPALEPAKLPAQPLLIWGREDRWVPPQVAERALEMLPQAQLKYIEDAGHNPMETHPEEFMRLLLAHLTSLSAPSG